MKKLSIHIVLFFFGISLFAQEVEIPELHSYCTDFTNTLDRSEINKINKALKGFDDQTSNQVIFVMIPTLDGYPIENFTYETATKNKIGTKENSNGILFVVAKNDKKMRIEVGYGLEGALPDALASSIIRNEVAPYFRRDDYFSGIAAGLTAIMKATVGEYTNENKRTKEEDHGFPWGTILFLIIFFTFFMGRGGRGGGLGMLWLGSTILSGGSRGGFGGGSFGGGGFGGFSGGGGGFGGGGASGGW